MTGPYGLKRVDSDIDLDLLSFLVAAADYLSTLSMSSTSLGSDSELTGQDSILWSSAVELRRGDTKAMLLKVRFTAVSRCL